LYDVNGADCEELAKKLASEQWKSQNAELEKAYAQTILDGISRDSNEVAFNAAIRDGENRVLNQELVEMQSNTRQYRMKRSILHWMQLCKCRI